MFHDAPSQVLTYANISFPIAAVREDINAGTINRLIADNNPSAVPRDEVVFHLKDMGTMSVLVKR